LHRVLGKRFAARLDLLRSGSGPNGQEEEGETPAHRQALIPFPC
jgi:hypothetical protein